MPNKADKSRNLAERRDLNKQLNAKDKEIQRLKAQLGADVPRGEPAQPVEGSWGAEDPIARAGRVQRERGAQQAAREERERLDRVAREERERLDREAQAARAAAIKPKGTAETPRERALANQAAAQRLRSMGIQPTDQITLTASGYVSDAEVARRMGRLDLLSPEERLKEEHYQQMRRRAGI